MKTKKLYLLSLMAGLLVSPSFANWQYSDINDRNGLYSDDGGRFVMSLRGGASYSMAKIKNNIGTITTEYYYDPTDDLVIAAEACGTNGKNCPGFEYAGIGDIASLPAAKDYSAFSFAAGASIGFTVFNHPQWRIEGGWDHITESDYNATPLFDGDVQLVGGNVPGITLNIQSSGVQSKISTDIISLMLFYDFFDGMQKPLNTIIPYVGFGVGYADTKTTFNLFDPYGDLSTSVDMQNFGTPDSRGILQFYRSENHTSNIAGLVALGLSYGISEYIFMDFGARATYIPQVNWVLTNEDGTRKRDWFSGKNLIYANVMLGLRFEF